MMMFWILYLLCTYFMISYALSANRSPWGRVAALGMVILCWTTTWGFIPGLLWGSVCWADARAGNH